jgi:WD40 repeat protein
MDAATGRGLGRLEHKGKGTQDVAVAPGGRWAAVLTRPGDLLLYERGKFSRHLERGPDGGAGWFDSVQFAPDGSSLVVAREEYLARYDMATGKRTARIEKEVRPLAFRPDGKELACGSSGGVLLLDPVTLRTWRTIPTRAGLTGLKTGGEEISSLAYSPDGRRLYVGQGDVVAVYDARTGRRENPSASHEAKVSALSFSPDGSRLASADEAGGVIVWDVFTGAIVRKLWAGRAVRALVFSPDGKRLAAGEGDSRGRWGRSRRHPVRVWHLAAGREALRFEAHLKAVQDVAFTQDGKRIITAGADGRVCWWDAATGKRAWQSKPLPEPRLLGVRQGRALVLTDDRRCEWHAPGAPPKLVREEDPDLRSTVPRSVLLRDGRLAVVRLDSVSFHSTDDGDLVDSHPVAQKRLDPVSVKAISPDGRFLLYSNTPTLPAPLCLEDLPEQRELAVISKESWAGCIAVFSPDSSRLAVAFPDTTIAIYGLRELRAPGVLGGILADAKAARALIAGRRSGVRRLAGHWDGLAALDARARKLVIGLGADDFEERERCTEELAKLGAGAVAALTAGARSRDLEVRLRCNKIQARLTEEDRERAPSAARLREAMRFMVQEGWPDIEVVLRGLTKKYPGTTIGDEARAALGSK